jgi:hypothetical protein
MLNKVEDSAVEARQTDSLFKMFAIEKNYKNFYKDDGFIRYFMGMVYENAGFEDEAARSYYLALKAYKNSKLQVMPSKNLINKAYSLNLKFGITNRTIEIKKEYPEAEQIFLPDNFGECVIICFSGIVPDKVENFIEIALGKAWAFVDANQIDNQEELEQLKKAKSVGISLFAKNYIKVSFPSYKDIPNKVVSFNARAGDKEVRSVLVQDLGGLAKNVLADEINKVYAKTIARAAIKFVAAKAASETINKNVGENFGILSNVAFNIYNSLTANADVRSWNLLPCQILTANFNLPQGKQTLEIEILGKRNKILDTKNISVDIKAGKKSFVFFKSYIPD